jgi:cobalt-zinc-cadmium efflux system outer membrane protein
LTRIRDRENMLAFGISVPLFTTHRNKAAVEAAVSREQQAGLHLAYLNAAIPAEVEGAYRKWSAARKALEVFDSVLKQSESNLRVIRQAWELGHLRFFDVLNEQRRLTDLRLARVDAEADLMRAAADLAHSVGGDL